MHRSIGMIAALLLILSLLTGCAFIEQLLGTAKPDLTVSSVEALANATTGEITGVRVVIKNTGTANATDVEYAVLLTDDETVSLTNDTEMYWDVVTLAIDEEQQIDIGNADITSYMSEEGISTPADGKYYIGVSVDPDNLVAEKTETDNEGVSDAKVWYLEGSPMLYVVQGSLTIPASLTYYDGFENVPVNLSAGAKHTVYFFAVPDGTDLPAAGESVDFDTFTSGWTKYTVQFWGSGRTVDYMCGIPLAGYYYIVALMDVDGNGKLTMSPVLDGPPTEPVALWPINPEHGGPEFTNITEDQTGADMEMSDGYNPPS